MSKKLCSAWLLGGLLGCGQDTPNGELPYTLRQALVIGGDHDGTLTEVNDDCNSAECEAVVARCGHEAYADVVLDDNGDVADVLCYRGNANVEVIGSDAVDSARAGNNTVLVLDAEDDGADVTGGVQLAGNNAVLFGAGADVSIVGGDLDIDKNNAIVRGVTIQGNVKIDKNNAQLSFTVIEGDLDIDANDTTLAECVVHGTVRITGNNTVLVQNRFSGIDHLDAKNVRCNSNLRFDDTNADGIVDDSELGSEITCS